MDDNIINEIIKYLESLHPLPSEDVPDIQLYMDQVTGFMEARLSMLKRNPEDKALTKTMINNYSKNRLLPPSEKKRYSREHLLLLLFIYYYKGILNLSDISVILGPLEDKYFNGTSPLRLQDIYDEIFSLEDRGMKDLINDIRRKYDIAKNTFPESNDKISALSGEDQEELRLFSFLSELLFDVFLKRRVMEMIIDRIRQDTAMKKSAMMNQNTSAEKRMKEKRRN